MPAASHGPQILGPWKGVSPVPSGPRPEVRPANLYRYGKMAGLLHCPPPESGTVGNVLEDLVNLAIRKARHWNPWQTPTSWSVPLQIAFATSRRTSQSPGADPLWPRFVPIHPRPTHWCHKSAFAAVPHPNCWRTVSPPAPIHEIPWWGIRFQGEWDRWGNLRTRAARIPLCSARSQICGFHQVSTLDCHQQRWKWGNPCPTWPALSVACQPHRVAR